MDNNYINIYNNLVNLTRNKLLYKEFTKEDTFSDRLIIFLFHFAFFLKTFKNKSNKKLLQEIYDYVFYQLELSIREAGYGDASINKKMKDYVNIFYAIIDKIDNWNEFSSFDKGKILSNFLDFKGDVLKLVDYFDNYFKKLTNNTLNSYIKGVIESEI